MCGAPWPPSLCHGTDVSHRLAGIYRCLPVPRALFHRTGTVTEVLCEWGYCGGLSQTVSVNGGIVVDCHRRFLSMGVLWWTVTEDFCDWGYCGGLPQKTSVGYCKSYRSPL